MRIVAVRNVATNIKNISSITVFVSVFVVVWGEALISRFVEYWMNYER